MTTGASSIVQVRPGELVDVLTADFQRRAEPQFAWKSCVSQFLALPGLRAFWPMSSVDYAAASQCRDVAGGAYHLTNNNSADFGHDNLFPYVVFNGSTNYLSRADGGAGNWADILGSESYIQSNQLGLTLGGWFYVDSLQSGNIFMMAKYEALGNDRSYALYHNDDDVSFRVYSNLNVANTLTFANRITVDEWFFFAGRYSPSAETKLWFNSSTATNAIGAPASLFDSTADFVIGARSDGTMGYLDGRASMCFLCATAVSDSIVNQLYEQSRVMFGVLA